MSKSSSVSNDSVFHKYTIYFSLTHRQDPISCYHSGPEWTWERWQWRATLHSSKLQHHWNLTIRLFSVISRNTRMWGSYSSAKVQSVYFYSPSRVGNPIVRILTIRQGCHLGNRGFWDCAAVEFVKVVHVSIQTELPKKCKMLSMETTLSYEIKDVPVNSELPGLFQGHIKIGWGAWLPVPETRVAWMVASLACLRCTGLFPINMTPSSFSIDRSSIWRFSIISCLSANFVAWVLAKSVDIPASMKKRSLSLGIINPIRSSRCKVALWHP